MAIYRKGEASLAADGTVTGYGTNWKDQLALVRIGATVVFLSGNAIGAIGTVSAIVSETQLQTIQTDGAVVARGKYFILLHDSLTVDGLAQNVAETLRYYQSQETEIAEAMDYFRTFDWEKFEKLATSVKTSAAAAKVSETNAKTSETNSKASENASAASKDAAAASAAAAKTSETNSKTSETNSKASENAANGSKVAAAGSATAADTSAKASAASQAAAKTSETNAKTSETNSKASENASLQSKNAAAGSATAAKTSETNSKTSETRSKTSETNSAASASTATSEADRAKREADRAAAANPDNALLKANNLSDVPNKTTARSNIGVGINDTLEVAHLVARNGLVTTTASNASNDNPSAPLVTRLTDSSGAVISQAEFRADRNGNLSLINRSGSPQFATLSQTGDFSTSNFVASNGFEGTKVELGQRRPGQPSYVDFHYGSKYDYDARIICDGMNSDQLGGGNLRTYAGFTQISSKQQTNITGGRLLVNTTDVNFETQVGLVGGALQVPKDRSDTTPVGPGLAGIYGGVDSFAHEKAANINLYSWYGVGFCTAYDLPTNGVEKGKPAVVINTRNGQISAKGEVISKGVILTSDFNKKTDIAEIDGEYVSDLLDKVGTYSYRYKEGSRYTAGVIAQELQNWMPQLVSSNEADGSLQVDYIGLLGYMHAAFKDEKAKRKSLEDRVKKLESYLAFKFPEDFEE